MSAVDRVLFHCKHMPPEHRLLFHRKHMPAEHPILFDCKHMAAEHRLCLSVAMNHEEESLFYQSTVAYIAHVRGCSEHCCAFATSVTHKRCGLAA